MSKDLSFQEALEIRIPKDTKYVAEITGFSPQYVRRCFEGKKKNSDVEFALIQCVLERERQIEEKAKSYFKNKRV